MGVLGDIVSNVSIYERLMDNGRDSILKELFEVTPITPFVLFVLRQFLRDPRANGPM